MGVFDTKPEARPIDYSVSHLGKGPEYDEDFRIRPGRALMWALEQDVLRDVLERIGPVPEALDFASGTGRVAGHLKRLDPSMDVQGVDISPSMLEVARTNHPDVRFRLADGREAVDIFGPGSFRLVTAFRFFANADGALRARAADQIRELVEPGGFVVFNNHRNFWSLRYTGARLSGRPAVGAVNRHLEELFTRRDFRVVERHSLGVWPHTEKRAWGLSWSAIERVEWANRRRWSRRHALGYNVIWVLRRVEPA